MHRPVFGLWASSLLLVVSCGQHTDSAANHAAAADKDAAPKIEADAGFEPLIAGDWTMSAGNEGYVCVRKTVDHDLYVHAFEAIIPFGTHHTLLTMGDPNGPDGVTPCSAAENRPLSVFGSGVGTDPLTLPDGLAVKIPAGTQLLLNLHLFNTGQDEISGTSGTKVVTLPEADVKHVAEGLLAGTVLIDIPPGATKTTIGHCTMASPTTIVAVAPHMHQLGIHEKVVAEHADGSENVLLDADYSFDEQSYRLIDPMTMAQGDKVRVECTQRNTRQQTVTFGESSLSEMCFAGLYRYPAENTFFICMDIPDGGLPFNIPDGGLNF